MIYLNPIMEGKRLFVNVVFIFQIQQTSFPLMKMKQRVTFLNFFWCLRMAKIT